MPSNYTPYSFDTFTTEEYKEFFSSFINTHHRHDVSVVLAEEDPNAHYGLIINFMSLLEDDQRIGSLLLAHPSEIFPIFDEALIAVENSMVEQQEEEPTTSKILNVKQNVHVRLDSLYMCPEICLLSGLPLSSDVGKFLEVQGTAIRAGNVRMIEKVRTFQCSKCGKQFPLEATIETGFQFEPPVACPARPCEGKSFTIVEGMAQLRDLQEIKIQEHAHKVGVGSIPRQITVILLDDLVDRCQAGDTVVVVGQVRTRWGREKDGERCDVEVVMIANNVRTDNDEKRSSAITEDMRREFSQYWEKFHENPLCGRDLILHDICPTIYGLYIVKLAVALVLIGGVARSDPSGMRIRGQCHLLLVGEPGTGKSQFLKYASKLGPRHVLATGGGTSSAGLTVAANKEPGGGWVLEAGALVLADGGVCCIDEFSSVKERDRATIHEAMEQQTISVAKAGIVCRLHTRTAILAATNAKGRYDKHRSLSENVALDSPLLSRFDMVLLLLDTQNADWDEKVASFILSGRNEESTKPQWPIDKLQSYISYVKTAIQPIMSLDATKILTEYYQRQRKSDLAESARSTIRLLESLIRVSEAHARLMFRDEVSSQDAIVAVMLVEASMATSALGGDVPSALHSDFPEDPELEYTQKEKEILDALGLSETIKPFQATHAIFHKFVSAESEQQKNNNNNNNNSGNDGNNLLPPPSTQGVLLPIKSSSGENKRSSSNNGQNPNYQKRPKQ